MFVYQKIPEIIRFKEVMKKGFFRICEQNFHPAPWTVFTGEQLIKIMQPYWFENSLYQTLNFSIREASVDQYEAQIRRVKEIVPEDRLLIWNVADGWEPVCKFLGKPVPSVPIPV
jgi:hypothetical protein